VPDGVEPPSHLVRFVRSLGEAERALDLGCGDGRLTAELRAGELTAADVSPVALARTRLPHAVLVELTPDAPLPFDDNAFDLVLCTETLEHVRDTQLFLSEARRVLRPGGELAISTPAHRRVLTASQLDPLSPHLRFYTRRSLARILHELGFEVTQLRRRRGSLLARARR
jgi:ubiquinone/menaquinone biosynthesis C-methylase UbiE